MISLDPNNINLNIHLLHPPNLLIRIQVPLKSSDGSNHQPNQLMIFVYWYQVAYWSLQDRNEGNWIDMSFWQFEEWEIMEKGQTNEGWQDSVDPPCVKCFKDFNRFLAEDFHPSWNFLYWTSKYSSIKMVI